MGHEPSDLSNFFAGQEEVKLIGTQRVKII